MRYAETGYLLEIDLTNGNIERVETDPNDTELYLGGLGTSVKIIWERVPPETAPFSPDNLLIFIAGLLCGTSATGCNRTIVTTISPQTGLLAFSMMGGFWAPELKYAGYDKVIFMGKSPDLVYIWINNDIMEIRDATHLKGKGTSETAELIRKDFSNEDISREWTETMEKMQTRLISCYNCPMKCGATITVPGLPTYMMKCFSKLTYTMAAISDLEFGLGIAQSATEYGIDGFFAPQVMAFAVELYEEGILTDQEMPGFPSNNEERFYWLLEHIVRRKGIGDILANGTYWAGRAIGKGAEEYAHNNIKKHEQLPLKLSMLNPIYYLMYCTGEKINITQIEGQFPQAPYTERKKREEFVKDRIQVPDNKFKQYFLDWEPRGEKSMPFYPTIRMCCEIVDRQETMHYIDDALGMCAGLSSFPLKPPYHIHNYPKFISSGAGFDMDEEKLRLAGKRYRALIRAINISRGMRRKDERPPEDHWKKRFPELEKELIDTYYKFKGWNKDGIPAGESLHELWLGYVAEDFVRRGILTEE